MSDYNSLDSREGSSESFTTLTDYEKSGEYPPATHEFVAERSKAALHRRPELISYFIHITSLLFTAIVLQLSFRNVYWADEDGWENNGWSMGLSQSVMAGLLQFCANLHEVFIVASLSAIAIDIIRRRLLVSRGVPFGFLMGGYRFGSATSLFSGSFWGPFIDATRHGKFELIGLGMLLGLGALYANAIGPASAVLIVPTLSWWPAYDLTTMMIGDGYQYPKELETTPWQLENCQGNNEDVPFGCPGMGASDLQNANWYTRPEDSANRSLTQRYGKARRNLYTSPTITPMTGNSVIRISTTIHSAVLEAIGLSGRFLTNFADRESPIYRVGRSQIQSIGSAGVLSPVVQAECVPASLNEVQSGASKLAFPTSLLATADDSDAQLSVSPKHWDFTGTWNVTDPVNFTWVDSIVFSTQIGFQSPSTPALRQASLGAIASIPYRRATASNPLPDVLLVTCVFDARWTATDISYDPGTSDTIFTNVTNLSVFTGASLDSKMRSKYGIGDSIHITTEWADLLNTPVAVPQHEDKWPYAIPNYLDGIQIDHAEVLNQYKTVTANVARFLSLTLADGLSRVGTKDESLWAFVWSPIANDWLISSLSGNGLFAHLDTTMSETGTTAIFKVRRYGWGYGVQTKTAWFAISILLIHAIFAVVYMIFTIAHWFIYRWSSRSWKSMEQLFALAMVSSQPPSLRGVSAGIGTWDTWKLEVAIRENQELHDSIELAFGERDGGPVGRKEGKIQWRKRYK